ncbi:hypothetical protein [Devosia sp. MC521]|uniref:hypothetical protein n=1 Tax=Devosia sp. MC521 TaxID=2759954 RepID=UPI0015F7C161|nr:hypothetical protein [Devosia sp. MC521]MBJ6989239.1 hypothetical protein [Devosia sp. MC521]QMW63332.1 hypothetical protein H4N61_03055 [Devosia sp. MC521]
MTSYELASPGVVAEKFQEGVVVLNLESGDYYDIGGRTAPLLDILEAGACSKSLSQALDLREPGVGQEMHDTIDQLVGFGILRPVPATVFEISDDVCQRILDGGKQFHLEAHSDLAVFIAADPIHGLDAQTGKKSK